MAATATSSHTCSGGSCSIHHHKAAPAKKPTTYKVRPALKSVPHRHHAPCSDPSCDIKHPHSHIKLVKPKSDCGHNHALERAVVILINQSLSPKNQFQL